MAKSPTSPRSEGEERSARFEAVYAAHYDAILAYAMRRVGSEAAADVVSETFLVAWRRSDQLPVDALPWLYAVARRAIANLKRSQQRRGALIERIAAGEVIRTPAGQAENVPLDPPILASAMRRLPERDREILQLVAWEELSARRAARALGCTTAAFRVRLHRARRRLRSNLEELEATVDGDQALVRGLRLEEGR